MFQQDDERQNNLTEMKDAIAALPCSALDMVNATPVAFLFRRHVADIATAEASDVEQR